MESILLTIKKKQTWSGIESNYKFEKEEIYVLDLEITATESNSLLEIIYPTKSREALVQSIIVNEPIKRQILFSPYSKENILEFRMSSFEDYSVGCISINIKSVNQILTKNSKSLESSIKLLGPWFQQINLKQLKTKDISGKPLKPMPNKPLPSETIHNHPLRIWEQFKEDVPENLTGKKILDIACNDGFYSFEMAKRGAIVIGFDNWYPNIVRAIFAKKILNLQNISFEYLDAKELDSAFSNPFDMVLCLGLLYHLDNPQSMIDSIAKITNLAYFESTAILDYEKIELIKDDALTWDGYTPTIAWLINAFKKSKFKSIKNINPGSGRAVFRVEK